MYSGHERHHFEIPTWREILNKRFRVQFNLRIAAVWVILHVQMLVALKFNLVTLRAFKNSRDIDRAPEALRTWSLMFGAATTELPFTSRRGQTAYRLCKEPLMDSDSLYVIWLKLRLNRKGNVGSLGNLGSTGHHYATTDDIPARYRSGAALECIANKDLMTRVSLGICDDLEALKILVSSGHYPSTPFPQGTFSIAQQKIILNNSYKPTSWGVYPADWIQHQNSNALNLTPEEALVQMTEQLLTDWNTRISPDVLDMIAARLNAVNHVFGEASTEAQYDCIEKLMEHGLKPALVDPDDLFLMQTKIHADDIRFDKILHSSRQMQHAHISKKSAISFSDDEKAELVRFSVGRPWAALVHPSLATPTMVIRLYKSWRGPMLPFQCSLPAFREAIPFICHHRKFMAIYLYASYRNRANDYGVSSEIERVISMFQTFPLRFRLMSTQRLIERARLSHCPFSLEMLHRMDIGRVFAAARTVDQARFVARRFERASSQGCMEILPEIIQEEMLMEDLGL